MDHLVQQILRVLIESGNTWLPFRQIARQTTGDVQNEHLIAAIVESRHDLFCTHADKRCKIRSEVIEAASRIEAPRDAPRRPAHLRAADAVVKYAGQLSPLRVRIIGADKGRLVLGLYLHALQMEASDDFRFSDDTPVELLSSGRKNSGHIAGASRDESTIFVAFQYEVLPVDLPAWLEVNRANPLLNLASYLSALQTAPSLALSLSTPVAPTTRISEHDSDVVAEQLMGLRMPWTRLLWGPPGAGKTYCAARIAARLVTHDPTEKVLVVAPSNIAVDTALAEVISALEIDEVGRRLISGRSILRYGYPRDERITSRPELFGPADLEPLSREIHSLQLEVRRLRQQRASEQDVAEVKTKLRELQEQRKARVSEHVRSARILATTVASAFTGTSPIVASIAWDTVIADEASMLSGATVLALAGLGKSRYLLVGDPRQLAPIFEWNRGQEPSAELRHWLEKDPYEFVELSSGVGWTKQIHIDDGRMARILAQRRCHPRIWSLVAVLYPQVDTAVSLERLSTIVSVPPLPGEPAVVLDLSKGRAPSQDISFPESEEELKLHWESACRRVGRTWENPPTAMIAIDVARTVHARIPDASIAIIAPYRGQVNLIRKWLYAERHADSKLDKIEVGTVHSFQGGEADVVIFDVVDGPPRQQPGILLGEETGMRLVNVAVTRARGKLVLIAHKDWLRQQNSTQLGILGSILFGASSQPRICTVIPPNVDFRADRPDIPGPESPIEQTLVDELRKRASELPPFVLQYRIFNENERIVSRADIAFVPQRVAVFCDGAEFHLQQNQWQRDIRQRRELTRLGWTVLPFTGREITRDVGACADDIVRLLCSRHS